MKELSPFLSNFLFLFVLGVFSVIWLNYDQTEKRETTSNRQAAYTYRRNILQYIITTTGNVARIL